MPIRPRAATLKTDSKAASRRPTKATSRKVTHRRATNPARMAARAGKVGFRAAKRHCDKSSGNCRNRCATWVSMAKRASMPLGRP